MNKNDFMQLIEQLPNGIDITVQTADAQLTVIRYTDQEPRVIHNDTRAILTGNEDYYAQGEAVKDLLSDLHIRDIVRLLRVPAKTVRL